VPGIGGVDLTRLLRSERGNAALPIFALTSTTMSDEEVTLFSDVI